MNKYYLQAMLKMVQFKRYVRKPCPKWYPIKAIDDW